MSRLTLTERARIIHEYYDRFHRKENLVWDPLIVVHEFEHSAAQEYVALISALLALGGVKQIIASARNWIARFDLSNLEFLNLSLPELEKSGTGFRHRFYIDRDLVLLTWLYQRSHQVYGSLGAQFAHHQTPKAASIETSLTKVIEEWKDWASTSGYLPGPHFKHLLNSPAQGSTCKRWLMFLKWMIRPADGIDLGLWSTHAQLKPAQLVIPLDTHLFKISRRLGLTHSKTANFKAALEVTQNLKRIDPVDPTRFDFSLCRFGMFDYRKMLSDR